MVEADDEVNERGNNSKIIVFTEIRHLKFVPGNVLSESDTYLLYSTAINIEKKIILTSAIFYAPMNMANYCSCVEIRGYVHMMSVNVA